ncbi:unnamed protein product [Amoebophrya sp. A120]|nr:unnamed protein product [Amoebophrya sp. A120]|eukprot:GSA120T00023166001.1
MISNTNHQPHRSTKKMTPTRTTSDDPSTQLSREYLVHQGAAVLCLNCPTSDNSGFQFGIDNHLWQTGPKFMGVKFIPPGVHFIYYSNSNLGDMVERCGFFVHLKPQEVLVRKWDQKTETLEKLTDLDEEARYVDGVRHWDFDLNLGEYPLLNAESTVHYDQWREITRHISNGVVKKIEPVHALIGTKRKDLVVEEEVLNLSGDSDKKTKIQESIGSWKAPGYVRAAAGAGVDSLEGREIADRKIDEKVVAPADEVLLKKDNKEKDNYTADHLGKSQPAPERREPSGGATAVVPPRPAQPPTSAAQQQRDLKEDQKEYQTSVQNNFGRLFFSTIPATTLSGEELSPAEITKRHMDKSHVLAKIIEHEYADLNPHYVKHKMAKKEQSKSTTKASSSTITRPPAGATTTSSTTPSRREEEEETFSEMKKINSTTAASASAKDSTTESAKNHPSSTAKKINQQESMRKMGEQNMKTSSALSKQEQHFQLLAYLALLGELELAFVAFLLGQNYDAFEQWKKLLNLFCSCTELIAKQPVLYLEFLRTLYAQLQQAPEDFFIGGESLDLSDNFLVHNAIQLVERVDIVVEEQKGSRVEELGASAGVTVPSHHQNTNQEEQIFGALATRAQHVRELLSEKFGKKFETLAWTANAPTVADHLEDCENDDDMPQIVDLDQPYAF